DLDKAFHFEEDEKIHTEISRKYNDEILSDLLKDSELEISHKLLDSKKYYADYILTKK
ncbi:MAG: L-histidine N(alpha)-methyltransferase, partial [Chryseobacterium sp.]|nr:L-histidine N(alpha)-methyltransferase [Chryseobacterium sp.]